MNKTIKEIIGLWREYESWIDEKIKEYPKKFTFDEYGNVVETTSMIYGDRETFIKETQKSFVGFMEWLKDNYKEE